MSLQLLQIHLFINFVKISVTALECYRMNSSIYPSCAAHYLANPVSNLTPILYYNPPRPFHPPAEAFFTDNPNLVACMQGSISCFHSKDMTQVDLLIKQENPGFTCSSIVSFGRIDKRFRILHCINNIQVIWNLSQSMKDNDFMVLHGCSKKKEAFKVLSHLDTKEELVLEVLEKIFQSTGLRKADPTITTYDLKNISLISFYCFDAKREANKTPKASNLLIVHPSIFVFLYIVGVIVLWYGSVMFMYVFM